MQMDARGRKAEVGALVPHLEATIEKYRPDILALDPYVKAHGVPENDNGLMDMVAQILTNLAAKHNIAVALAHHARKGAGEPGDADRMRGASATKDAGRLSRTVTVMARDEGKRSGSPLNRGGATSEKTTPR
jgi:RecA-family ATPase